MEHKSLSSALSEDSSHSVSSYECLDEFSDSEIRESKKRKLGQGTLLDDVKVILRKHDKKLLMVEDDFRHIVRWLHEKFGFIATRASITSNDSAGEGNAVDEAPDTEDHEDVFQQDHQNNEDSKLQKASKAGMEPESNPGDLVKVLEANRRLPTNNIESQPDQSTLNTKTTRVRPQPRRTRVPKGLSELPSQCDTCGKFLNNPNSLRQHKQIHLDIRPFTCTEPNCGKSFRRKFHLQTHSLIHKGVKKEQCGFCGKLFLLQKDLVSHERIHTGVRPFSCKDCPKSFNLKSHLVMHVRTHTGEKPYHCTICSKSFSQSNSLRLHKMKVHKEQNPETQPKETPKRLGSKNKKRKTQKKNAAPNSSETNVNSANKLPIFRNQGRFLNTLSKPSLVTLFPQPIFATHTQPIEITDSSNSTLIRNEPIIFPVSQSSLLGSTLQNEEVSGIYVTSEIIDLS